MNTFVILTAFYVAAAIIALWVATLAIFEHRRFRPFLPVALTAGALCIMATVLFYDFLFTFWHSAFSALSVMCLVWMLVESILSLNDPV